MKRVLIFCAAAYCAASVASAQVVHNQYVIELRGDSAATAMLRKGIRRIAEDRDFHTRRAQVHASQNDARAAVGRLGGTVLGCTDIVKNSLIVSLPDAKAAQLAQIPGVKRVWTVHVRHALLDHALPLSHIPDAWAQLPGGMNTAGAGIKIAILDSGIDITNPGLQDPALTPPPGFPIVDTADTSYVNNKVIVARNYTSLNVQAGGIAEPTVQDHLGHGTAVAMAAAGVSAPYSVQNILGAAFTGTVSGAAPKAFVGDYKIADGNGDTTDVAIMQAIDDAVGDQMDVINVSYGGPAISFGDSVDVDAVEAAFSVGVICTIASSDSGPDPGTVSDPGTAADAITAGSNGTDRILDPVALVGASDEVTVLTSDGPDPGKAVTGPLADVTLIDSTSLACAALPAKSLAGAIALIERGSCAFETKLDNAQNAGAIGAIIYAAPANSSFFVMGVGAATLPAMSTDYGSAVDMLNRLAANPSVSATLVFPSVLPFPLSPNRMADFSGRGPNIDFNIKPDVVAAGENIVDAAESSDDTGYFYDSSGFLDYFTVAVDGGGTSISAPIVAGAAAVLKGARPGLTAQQYRSLLINSASPIVDNTGKTLGVQQAGAGLLNLVSSLNNTVTANPVSISFGTAAGSVNASKVLTLTNIGPAADTLTISVLPLGSGPAPTLSAATLPLAAGAFGQVTVQFNVSALPPGEYQGFIQVASTQTSVQTDIPYWFGATGVSPANIAILFADTQGSAGEQDPGAILFQVSDIAGVPLDGVAPQVTTSSPGARVRGVLATGDTAGTYEVNVKIGTVDSVFTITAGHVTKNVWIPAN
ncbi:MAG TPA: S8 family serine peptidase [Bryobacteraceae bacterium]|nr:S8 family serine peptidase [Bryobacteraceae bacterium]